jgi:hypothetical protein
MTIWLRTALSRSPTELGGFLIRALFIVGIAASIFPPFIPLAGPLSLDDLPPLIAVVLALFTMCFVRERTIVDATIFGFALLGLAGLISSAANSDGLSEFGRFAGRSAGRTLFAFGLVLGTRALLGDKRWQRAAVFALVIAATVESLFCLWAYQKRYIGPYGLGVADFASWSVLKGEVRVQGTFSGVRLAYEGASVSANFLAAYLIMSIPVTIGLAFSTAKGRARDALYLGALVQLIVLYLTYTRAALIALGVGIMVLGFVLGKRKQTLAALAFGAMVTLAIPSVRAKFMSEGHNRYALWWASWEITKDNALVGVGDGNYDRVLHDEPRYHNTPFGPAETASHNSIMLSAANHGIAGGVAQVLLYGSLVAAALYAFKRSSGSERYLAAGIVSALAAYLVQDQFNNLAYIPKVATQMWFLFGVLTAAPPAARLESTDANLSLPATARAS